MKKIRITWRNHAGETRTHTIFNESLDYAKNLWQETIFDCAGWSNMSVQEKRESQMILISVEFIT